MVGYSWIPCTFYIGNSIFTGAFYNDYSAPPGFNWESKDEPIIDNPIFENNNVHERLKDFMKYINERVRVNNKKW